MSTQDSKKEKGRVDHFFGCAQKKKYMKFSQRCIIQFGWNWNRCDIGQMTLCDKHMTCFDWYLIHCHAIDMLPSKGIILGMVDGAWCRIKRAWMTSMNPVSVYIFKPSYWKKTNNGKKKFFNKSAASNGYSWNSKFKNSECHPRAVQCSLTIKAVVCSSHLCILTVIPNFNASIDERLFDGIASGGSDTITIPYTIEQILFRYMFTFSMARTSTLTRERDREEREEIERERVKNSRNAWGTICRNSTSTFTRLTTDVWLFFPPNGFASGTKKKSRKNRLGNPRFCWEYHTNSSE